MPIHVNFNLILVAIFLIIFVTGYIRGAGIELLRVLKVVIPFFVLYFYGDVITNALFSSPKIVEMTYTILPNIPYRNTIAALSTQFGVYLVVYVFLTIFLWRLGKLVLDERIEYLFGRTNSIFGGLFSLVRMYVLVSIFIIPFYALDFTDHHDFLTDFILDHPPHFSRLGLLIETSKPTVDSLNEMSASFKIMDIESLNKYASLITDVKGFLADSEDEAGLVYSALPEEKKTFDNNHDFLEYYVQHYQDFQQLILLDKDAKSANDLLQERISRYQQVYLWAFDHDIQEQTSTDEIIQSFIANYPNIVANSNDSLTVDVLEKVKLQAQVYLALSQFLAAHYNLELTPDLDLLNDDHLQLILDDFEKDDLITRLNQIDATSQDKARLINEVERFDAFDQKYLSTYKPQMVLYDDLLQQVSFKYKLVFAIMKDKELNKIASDQEPSPLLYLFTLDSLDFLHLVNQKDIYYDAGKVYVSLFLIHNHMVDQEVVFEPISATDVMTSFTPFLNQTQFSEQTDNGINKEISALLQERNDESYIEFLILNGYAEKTLIPDLLANPQFTQLISRENAILLANLNEKLNKEM